MEKGASTDGKGEVRLMELLRDFVEEVGPGRAAAQLGVDRKTLWRTLNSGSLTPRLAGALKRRLVASERSDAVRRRERVAALEQRVETLEETVRTGLAGVRSELGALSDRRPRGLPRPQRGTVLAQPRTEAGGTASDAVPAPSPASVKAGPQPVIGQPPATAVKAPVRRPWRAYPELVTLEPEEGEEGVYGEVLPLIAEWRRVRVDHLDRGKRRVERATAWVRMRELELALIGEHALTLAPAAYPWTQVERGREVWRREQSLADARGERRRGLCWRWLRRLLTLGLWRR